MSSPRTTDIAFSPAVKEMQDALGTRAMMDRMSAERGFQTEISPALAVFIRTRTFFFLGTASAEGRPYIQHRGGAAGFLRVTGPRTLRFVDLPGNKQYITLGNLSENDRLFVFLIDYETRQRIKIWGRGRMLDLIGAREIEIAVEAWDPNCQSGLPALYTEETVAQVTAKLTKRVAELEAALRQVKRKKEMES